MSFNADQAYQLLKKLSFPRLGGTPDEKSAADLLTNYLKKSGLAASQESFPVENFQHARASLEILKPYRKKYPVVPVGLSGQTPPRGITAEIVEINSLDPAVLKKARRQIALFYGPINKKNYPSFRQNKIKALVSVMDHSSALLHLKLRAFLRRDYGKIPSVIVGYEHGLEMLKRKAQRARVRLTQKEFTGRSHNVITTIPGRTRPQEKIVICAHYDSVDQCGGAIDNASGSAIIYELARYFKKNPPHRTLIFVWCGSEELGLLGSQNYVKRHRAGLRNVQFVLNVDVAGIIMGENGATVCGSPEISKFVKKLAERKNMIFSVHHAAYSSDNIYFNDRGIPSVSLHRRGSGYGHTVRDQAKTIDAPHLKITGQLALDFLKQVDRSKKIPFSLKIPAKDKKFTEEYIKKSRGIQPSEK